MTKSFRVTTVAKAWESGSETACRTYSVTDPGRQVLCKRVVEIKVSRVERVVINVQSEICRR